MPYQLRGSRFAQGAADPNNPLGAGNWTITFPPNLININDPEFECWKIVVGNGAPRAFFNVYINNTQFDTAIYAPTNSWDPQQPMILRPQDTVFFYYSDPATDGFQPFATMWFRYEVTLGSVFGVTS